MAALSPAYAGYKHWRDRLATYRIFSEAGGWPTIPSGSKLQRGDRSERVIRLRLRLAAEGFLTNAVADDSTQFDIDIDPALKKFQLQNGLEANGILGANTFKTLNISAHQRVRQIVANMERWCWLPQMLGDRYILARISKTGNSLGCSYAGATSGSLNPF